MSQPNTAISIAANMAKLLALVETGEFSPEDIADTLEGEELALSDKLDGIMSLVRNLEGQAKTVGDEVNRLSARKKSFEGQATHLKKYALECLQAAGLKNLKTERNTLSVRAGSKSVVIDNVDEIPDDMVSVDTVITPDKKAIKEVLSAGGSVAGAHLETGPETLQAC